MHKLLNKKFKFDLSFSSLALSEAGMFFLLNTYSANMLAS